MLRKIFPHVTIVLCNMYIVFYCIDRVNSAMSFIDNSITKALLLVLCVLSIVNSIFLIGDNRNKVRRENRKHASVKPQPVQRYDQKQHPSTRSTSFYSSAPRRTSRFGS